MNPRTGRLLALAVGPLAAAVSYVAHPTPLLAATTGAFWLAAALLARRNASLVYRRGNRWSGAQGGLSSLAALGAFAVASSLSLPAGLGLALGLFVLGVSYAMTGVGVEMAEAYGGDASAVHDGDDGAPAGR